MIPAAEMWIENTKESDLCQVNEPAILKMYSTLPIGESQHTPLVKMAHVLAQAAYWSGGVTNVL